MGAKVSQEMKDALELVKQGIGVRDAAEQAGVWFTSLYQAIKREETKAQAKKRNSKKK